ncbi:hypothetical protein AB8613_21025 [Vibrio sp. BS-M-Sm-2]|uniref:hypothetical protein n=1 Tax=Vibrio sp. BS-M-Sm-2 TaxID=3241167 RepID=UPI00355903CA
MKKEHLAIAILLSFSTGAFASSNTSYYDRVDVGSGIDYIENENGKYAESFNKADQSYKYTPRLSKGWILGPTVSDANNQNILSNAKYCESLPGNYHPPTPDEVENLMFFLNKNDEGAVNVINSLGFHSFGMNMALTQKLLFSNDPSKSWFIYWYYDLNNQTSDDAKYGVLTEDSSESTHYSCAPDL